MVACFPPVSNPLRPRPVVLSSFVMNFSWSVRASYLLLLGASFGAYELGTWHSRNVQKKMQADVAALERASYGHVTKSQLVDRVSQRSQAAASAAPMVAASSQSSAGAS